MAEKQRHLGKSQSETADEQQKRSLLIAGYLQQLGLPSMFNRELTEEDYHLWQTLLRPYPLKGIEFAFENWARNSSQWPKPANILELIAAWNLSNRTAGFVPCGNCMEGWIRVTEGRTAGGHPVDPKMGALTRCQCFLSHKAMIEEGCSKLCEARHGNGYHTNDIKWLFKRMLQEVAAARPIDSEALLKELDSKREGGAPAWRRA